MTFVMGPVTGLRRLRSIRDGCGTRSYARCAVFEALESGLTTRELGDVLAGLGPTELVPPRPGEDPGEYGCRAASEIMVRYIVDGIPEGHAELVPQSRHGGRF